MVERIDPERLPAARAVLDYVVPRVREDGRFHPEDSLWAESSGYQAQLAGTLAVAGKLLDDERCKRAARRVVYRMLENTVEGLWSLDWWWDHHIVEPPSAEWRQQNTVPDPRYTPTVLFNLGLYHRVSGDDAVVAPARDAMARMFDRWDYSEGSYVPMTPEFVALAVWAWEEALPEFSARKDSTVKWVADTFVKEAPTVFPFASAVRMTLLLMATGTKYLESVIQPGMEAFLAEPSRRFDHEPNDFHHSAATSDHVNIRANIAVMLLMKSFDLVAGSQVYTGTPLYEYLSGWTDGMRAPGGSYYECQDVATGRLFGQGSPAHYIPLWWILGATTP